jgi:metallophosphoesterase (TIGR03767 family)
MPISRRGLLAMAGAAAVAVAVESGLSLRRNWMPWALAAEEANFGNGRGLFGSWTTLDRTVKQAERRDVQKWTDYVKLQDGPGEGHVVRTDLMPDAFVQPTRALETFVQITDLQIVDEKSPGRVEFTDRWSDLDNPVNQDVASAYRPQEMLSTQIVEAMVQAIRGLRRAPMTGLTPEFTVATGDMVDNVQYNETRWYINLLDGGHPIRAESGVPGGPQSVSDLFSDNNAVRHDPAYWDPAGSPTIAGDRYRSIYHFPLVPTLLPAARREFTSTGLGMPWYAVMGNHDGLVQGNYPVSDFIINLKIPDISDHATSGRKPYTSTHTFGPDFDPGDIADFVNGMQYHPVPADDDRRFLHWDDFVNEHFNTTGTPLGHGFVRTPIVDDPRTPINETTAGKYPYTFGTWYSRTSTKAPIAYITIDTVNYRAGDGGRVNGAEFEWLEAQLKSFSSSYLNSGGTKVTNRAEDKLIVVFAHHTIDSIDNDRVDKYEPPFNDFYYKKDVEKLLLRFPNVVLYVCGHTHRNDIIPHRRGTTTALGNTMPGTGGFWEITTASHIDWPVQSRILEITAGDSMIGVYTTMLDIAAPVDYNGDLSNPVALASLARELSANDPTERPKNSHTSANPDGQDGRRGHGDDRNTLLMVPMPFPLATLDQWGSSITVTNNNAGDLAVFGTSATDAISWRKPTSATQWVDWAQFPVSGTLQAVTTETNANGQIELFGADSAHYGQVWHSVESGAGSGTWGGWTSRGTVNARSLAAIRHADQHMELFITTPAGDVWHMWQQSGVWGSWSPGFGVLDTNGTIKEPVVQVATARNADGSVQVFALSKAGEVWSRTQILTGGWTGWTSLNIRSLARFVKIAASQHEDGRLALFLVDHDRRVWRSRQRQAGSAAWDAWSMLDDGQRRMTQIAARANAGKLIQLFGADHTGQVWTRTQTATNADTWTAWSIFSEFGHLRPDIPQVLGAGTPEKIIVPTLVGLPESVAKALIVGAGLAWGAVTQESNGAPAGTLFAQTPQPGGVADKGAPVAYSVSTGGVAVPAVVGKSKQAAGVAIAAAGLVASYSGTKDCIDPQRVYSQNPTAGRFVATGSTVHVSYDSGTVSSCEVIK